MQSKTIPAPATRKRSGTSPRLARVNFNTKNVFKPLFLVQASEGPVVPPRQLADMQCALTQGGVNATAYTILQISDDNHKKQHAISLWRAPDPTDPEKTVGADVIEFLQANLN